MTLAHCTPWPEDFARRYTEHGYWAGETFCDMLADRARHVPDRLAVVAGAVRWTYRDLQTEADRLARGFTALGIAQGQRVVVQLPNRAEFFSVLFALFRIGAVPVLALPAHRKLEIGYFCQHAEAVAYVMTDRHAGFDHRTLADEVRTACPGLRHILIAGEAGAHHSLDNLHADTQVLPPPPAARDIALFQLSGGSTGTPKLIPRTHDDYYYSVRASAAICGLSERSVYLCVLPASHNFPLSSAGTLGALYAGGTVVMAAGADPDHAFGLIAREKVTITGVVPPLVPVWLDAARTRGAQLASLQVLQVGGARFDPSIARRCVSELGCTLQQVFGMAEGLVNYTRLDDPIDEIVTTQGRPMSADDEVLVVDDEDQPVAVGTTGHLLTRGPYTIRGYYKAGDHNTRAFTPDGFYRTGDRVRMTAAGNLVVEGRAKDQINRGGEKISAEEVEQLLLTHPQVVDAAIVAMPDPHLGEKSCAYVIPADDGLQAIALGRFLRAAGIAAFKVPDRFEFLDSFPKTAVGKVSKKALRQRIADRMTASPTPF